MSGNPSPPSNVVPMPTNWPGPMFMPKSWPQPPSCFSELASLNACYDSIQMMNQILAKVITDLVTNDKAVQTAIVEAIAASGSNVPLIGVTNGQDAQPGQVGEFIIFTHAVTYPTASSTQVVTMGTLPPGDWDLWGAFTANQISGVSFYLNPLPAGFTTGMVGTLLVEGDPGTGSGPSDLGGVVMTMPERALTSVPSLLALSLSTNILAGGTATAGNLYIGCRRRR